MRHFKLFIACMLMVVLGIGQVWATEESVDVTPANALNDGGVDPITIACAKGDGTSNPAISSGQLRLYQASSGKTTGNTITFSSTYAITKIEFTFANSMTADNGSFSDGTYDSGTTTWTGSTNSLTLTVTGTTSGTRIYITAMKVYYETGGGTPTCATPTFTPAAGSYEGTQNVTITSTTGATIYYTTDGSTPTTTSSVYSTAIPVAADMTIKAYAVKSEYNDSEVAEAAYTITEGPDVTINLLDEAWGFPTSKTVEETSYTDGVYTIKVAGTTGQGFRTYGTYFLLGQNGAYIELPEFDDPIEKIVISGNSNGSGSVEWNIFNGGDAVSTAATGCKNDAYTFNIDPMEANVAYRIKVTNAANLQIKTIKIYYGSAPAVNKPTISGEEKFVTSTSVSLACTTTGADIYYTLNGSDPQLGGGTKYSAPFSLTEDATVNARAKLGDDWSGMVSKTFTKVTALTTMDAIFAAASTAGNYYITFSDSWVVTGVSTNGKNVYITDGTKGMILFNNSGSMGLVAGNTLSGTVERSLKLYNGAAELDGFTTDGLTIGTASLPAVQELDAEGIAALSGVNTGSLIKISGECTEESSKFYIGGVQLYNSLYAFSVSAGTSYECTGVYVQYNSTKEVLPRSAADIVASATIAVTGVDLTESTASVEVGETVTLHASVVPSTATNKTIVWSVQSGSDKASVADGVVTGLAAGEAVIRAASDEDATLYDECTVTVTAADPTKHVVTFDATVDKTTEATELSITKGDLTIAVTEGDGRFNNGTDYRPYKNAVFTVSCSSGNITKIEFTCTSSKPITGFADLEGLDKANEVWTGNAPSVSFTASGAQVQMTQLVITYKEDNRAEAGLAWNPADDIEITVGDAFSAPALNNPNSIDAAEISIESSNTSLATVTAGVVELVADATGTATITATFAGNASYKPATVSYDITVNAAAPILTDYYEKVTSGTVAEGTYLIVYETANVAFNGALGYDNDHKMDVESNTIDVDITTDHKIGVTPTTSASTFYIDPTAGTIQAASGKYIGVTSYSNGLTSSNDPIAHSAISVDEGNANIVVSTSGGDMTLRYNAATNQLRFRYYKSGQQDIQLYKLANEVIKPAAGLAWDPSDNIEITVGDAFTAPTLLNPNSIDAAEITIESSNTSLATVTAGVVELVDAATGTATITATFAGNADYKPATVSYTIKVNPASSIYVSPSLNVNFGSVEKDAALPDDKTITVTLNNVAAATATLGGTNPEAFSIDPATLTASGDITISVVSTATAGSYSATLTISDDASVAAPKVVNLSLTVTNPATEEAAISTTSKWVAATTIEDGMQVLITGVKDEVTYAMGEQKSTNRAAYVATVDGEGVLTPGEGTMAFTLVAQGDGTYAIRTSNGKYLYAAKNDANHLKTQDEVDDNAKWTLTVTSAVAASSTNRNVMQFNGGSSKLFSCYASASQEDIQFYVPKQETPEPDYVEVRDGLEVGRHYTVCLAKNVTAVKGATFWSLTYKKSDNTEVYLEEVKAPFDAGIPFIFQATAAKLEVVYGNESANEGKTNGALVGTLEDLDADAFAAISGNIYLLISNALRPRTSGNFLNANRAYVNYDALTPGQPQSAPGKQVRSMPMQPKVATGVENGELLNGANGVQKVLINGELFILQGEKMYNASGVRVK